MKKTNEKVVEATSKKVKPAKRFFLYADTLGFVRLDESGAPNFADGELVTYPTRAKAKFARDFFVSLKLADDIDVLTKVA